MPAGGLIIVAAREEAVEEGEGLEPGSYIRLTVRDEGVGMDEATLKRATEPFFTTKEPGKGTGLGLSMVHGIAEQSGGRLVLRSREGEGTTAELWLPVASPGVQTFEPARLAEPVTSDQALVVLVVDDDLLVLTNTVAMLEDLGHRALAASSAAAALAVLKERNAIDLLVTDHLMPQMTGLQLVAEIRKQRPGLPAILATGYAEFQRDGGEAIPRLAKPFTQGELAAMLSRTVPKNGRQGRVVKLRTGQ
jgi:CheY-like chemotaxis protein